MNQEEIRKEVESYYLNLFKDEYLVRLFLDDLEFDKISSHEKRWLERPISEDELHKSIMGIKGDRELGLDGFTITFFQRCWDIVKGDMMKVLDEFYYSEEFYERLNDNYIVLILKKNIAKEMKDFRLICLLSSVYKLI